MYQNQFAKTLPDFVSKPLFDETLLLSKDPTYPKITVVTPSFNQAIYLERTILSVLNQNYPNLEYIILDGGSNDNSVDIIKKYEKYLTFWVSEKDNGQASAINRGFKMATGELLCFQNSDDVFAEGCFDSLLRRTEHIRKLIYFLDICYLLTNTTKLTNT
jgi:glycosyltransferase involved in cell wall biosynthesis